MTSTVYIAKNVYGGDGLGRLGDGRVVFVPGAWAGEQVKAEIVEEKKHFVKARLVEVVEKSPDRVVGLDRLKAIHLNDSMNVLGAHKDRHEKIGKGKIGLDALMRVVNHPKLKDLPFYLETPCDLDGYRAEIALLKSLRSL